MLGGVTRIQRIQQVFQIAQNEQKRELGNHRLELNALVVLIYPRRERWRETRLLIQ